MSYSIPNLTKTKAKATLICLSSGQIEKVYLEKILKDKNELYYHSDGKEDKELDQLVKRHKKDNSIDKVIDGICKDICCIVNRKLDDQLSFGNQNSDYLLVVITDHDKAPLDSFDKLKKSIDNEINKLVDEYSSIFSYELIHKFIFSHKGFEAWLQFYYTKNINDDFEKDLKSIKNKSEDDISNKDSIIFNNHKKAVDNYYKMTKYSKPLGSYTEIGIKKEIPYSDFPYFFEFLDENYDTEILI